MVGQRSLVNSCWKAQQGNIVRAEGARDQTKAQGHTSSLIQTHTEVCATNILDRSQTEQVNTNCHKCHLGSVLAFHCYNIPEISYRKKRVILVHHIRDSRICSGRFFAFRSVVRHYIMTEVYDSENYLSNGQGPKERKREGQGPIIPFKGMSSMT